MAKRLKHGHARVRGSGKASPTYETWRAMKKRCKYKPEYSDVTVCDEWTKSFETFLADMGARPEGKTIDRINGNLGYFKENCRWATAAEQGQNRKTCVVDAILVAEIRSLYESGVVQADLHRRFDLRRQQISRIVRKDRWK